MAKNDNANDIPFHKRNYAEVTRLLPLFGYGPIGGIPRYVWANEFPDGKGGEESICVEIVNWQTMEGGAMRDGRRFPFPTPNLRGVIRAVFDAETCKGEACSVPRDATDPNYYEKGEN